MSTTINVKLINYEHVCAPANYYGIPFEAFGKPKLSEDKKRFTNVTLIAEGVDESLVKSLIDAGKLEEMTDAEVKSVKAKADKAAKAEK